MEDPQQTPKPPAVASGEVLRQLRSLRVLAKAFCAADLAEPLGNRAIPENPTTLPQDATLFELIRALTEEPLVWIRGASGIEGVVCREDLQKLVGRTWLFGIVAFIEIYMSSRIALRWSEAEWSARLPVGRLEKARVVHAERVRRGQVCSLIDCLQLSDKSQLLIDDPEELARFNLETKNSARRALGNLELLRNNLAHSQEIVASHWARIAKLAARLEQTLEQMNTLGI